jgi:hypothetical protein
MKARFLMKDMEERYIGEGWSRKRQMLENHGVYT